MWPVNELDVTLWLGGPRPARDFITHSPAEALAALGQGPLLLEVDAVQRGSAIPDGVSLGLFCVWLNGDGMAWIRLDEHCEHYARDPARTRLEGEVGGFINEDGSLFAVLAADAVTASQARLALADWLQGVRRSPILTWDS